MIGTVLCGASEITHRSCVVLQYLNSALAPSCVFGGKYMANTRRSTFLVASGARSSPKPLPRTVQLASVAESEILFPQVVFLCTCFCPCSVAKHDSHVNIVQPLCFLSAGKWSHHLCAVNIFLRTRFRMSSCLCRCIGWLGGMTFQIVDPNTGRESIWPACLLSRSRSSHPRCLRWVVARTRRPRYVRLRSMPKSSIFLGTSNGHFWWILIIRLGFHPRLPRVGCTKISWGHE